jgi:hypothetical protein
LRLPTATQPGQDEVYLAGNQSILNPRHRYLLAHYGRRDGGVRADCAVDQGLSVSVRCDLPDEGTYASRHGTYHQVGEIEALRRSRR